MEELDATSSNEDGFISASLKQIKRWLLTHSQHLNFFTIFLLASVSLFLTHLCMMPEICVHVVNPVRYMHFM